MRKTGSQLVEYPQKVVQKLRTKCMQFLAVFDLSTLCVNCTRVCAHVMQQIVHITGRVFTEVTGEFSPLSTALIKSTIWK